MQNDDEKVEESTEADDVESLKSALEEEKAKTERYLANWQRTQADFENYKKRVEQERSDTVKFSNMALTVDLLPVLDDFRRAFESLPADLAGLTWVEGIRLIYRKLQAVLEAQGLAEIKSVGKEFDPALHEAVTQVDGEEGKVVDEVQKGYTLHGRVIRPALVVVGKGRSRGNEQAGGAED